MREVLKVFQPEVVRYFMLGSHYRSPLNYSDGNLHQARAALARLYLTLRGLPESEPLEYQAHLGEFRRAMNDDFNTPEALAFFNQLAGRVNTAKAKGDAERAASLGATLRRLAAVLGLLRDDPEAFLKRGAAGAFTDAEIEELIVRRTQARRDKQWAEADRVRRQLDEHGILLEDSAERTTWRRK